MKNVMVRTMPFDLAASCAGAASPLTCHVVTCHPRRRMIGSVCVMLASACCVYRVVQAMVVCGCEWVCERVCPTWSPPLRLCCGCTQQVDVNCKGVLNGIAAVLPGMLESGRGHIVNITSDAGRKVFPGLSVYSGTKFFVEAVSQGLRLETAGTGVRVTTVQVCLSLPLFRRLGSGTCCAPLSHLCCRRVGWVDVQPGNVATPLLAKSKDAEALKQYGEPSGAKILSPSDIGSAVVYAVSQPPHVAVNEIMVEPRDEPC